MDAGSAFAAGCFACGVAAATALPRRVAAAALGDLDTHGRPGGAALLGFGLPGLLDDSGGCVAADGVETAGVETAGERGPQLPRGRGGGATGEWEVAVAAGTSMIAWQRGHFPRLPASSSRTFRTCWHCPHVIANATRVGPYVVIQWNRKEPTSFHDRLAAPGRACNSAAGCGHSSHGRPTNSPQVLSGSW